MLYLLTPRQTARLPLNQESRLILQTGEIRLAHPSDRLTELSENALFLVRLSAVRKTAAIVLTADRGKLMVPLRLSKIIRFYALRYTARRLWRKPWGMPYRVVTRRFSIQHGSGAARRAVISRLMNWCSSLQKQRRGCFVPDRDPRRRVSVPRWLL
jgi:hypothetical protein